MPPDAVTVLLMSEHAEEIKLITKSLRSSYPGCRVEVVYSQEEALEWVSKQDWHIVVLDESLLGTRAIEVLQEIRRRTLRSALVVAVSRQESDAALHLMQQGADYCLFKNTPAFLMELPVVAREVLEKRGLRERLELAEVRYHRLIDNLADMAYELDAEGRFLYVSPAAQVLLHYDPQELLGLHYSAIIPSDELKTADRRFNERRSEGRATRRFKLRLLEKDPAQPPLEVEVNATALYDRHRQFVGTLGIVRPVTGPPFNALQRLADFPRPLTNILTNTEQLLETVHDLCEQVGLPRSNRIPAIDAPPQDLPRETVARSPQSGQLESLTSQRVAERRTSPRIPIQMHARARINGTSWEGTAVNISQGGIFLLLKGAVTATQDQAIRLGFGSDVGVLEIPASLRHIRSKTASGFPTQIPMTGMAIRFSPLDEVKEKILQSLLEGLRTHAVSMTVTALLIASPPPQSEEAPAPQLNPTGPPEILTPDAVQTPEYPGISTEFLQCFNGHGQRLAVCHDCPDPEVASDLPIVILAPGYGRTKTDYIDLAYDFACNDFRVLRYDHSSHVGESDGGMVQTTLTGMEEDMLSMIRYAMHRWPTSPIIMVACDVPARVALKHAAHHPATKLLVLFAPVFDVQYALMTYHEKDLIGAALRGKQFGVSNVLGFNIDADAWITDVIQGQFADFSSTHDDLSRLHVPMLVYASEADVWIRPNVLSQIKLAFREKELTWLESSAASHTLDNREQTREVFRQMVADSRARFYPNVQSVVRQAEDRDVIRQRHRESERTRRYHQMDKSTAVAFWRDYLDRSHSLVNFSEYWHMLDHIHRLLGPLDSTMRILDAGCGNGNFGMFLLIAASFQPDRLVGENNRLNYVGLDLVPTGLFQAKSNLIRVAAELRGKFAPSARQSIMNATLLCIDLNAPLPFQDGQFDRLVCNLVLGYLLDPLLTLRELVRVLTPHGKLVVTTFKPHADLSQIYRKFLSLAQGDQEKMQAKATVEAAGTISQDHENAFRFFERQELAGLLMESGASQPRIYSTFANQAYIAVAEKLVSESK